MIFAANQTYSGDDPPPVDRFDQNLPLSSEQPEDTSGERKGFRPLELARNHANLKLVRDHDEDPYRPRRACPVTSGPASPAPIFIVPITGSTPARTLRKQTPYEEMPVAGPGTRLGGRG